MWLKSVRRPWVTSEVPIFHTPDGKKWLGQKVGDLQSLELASLVPGTKLRKKSGKPFKSRLWVNTVKGEMINPRCPKGKMAYTFFEDDSCVNQDMCEITSEGEK